MVARLHSPGLIRRLVLGAAAVTAVAVVALFVGRGGPSPLPDAVYVSAGAPWIDGLVVPVGTRLVGAPIKPGPTETISIFEITGDPFAAWDDLVTQANAHGWSLPPSGPGCDWLPLPSSTSSSDPVSNVLEPYQPPKHNGSPVPTGVVCGGFSFQQGADVVIEAGLQWFESEAALKVEIQRVPPGPHFSFPVTDTRKAPEAAARLVPPIRRLAPKRGDRLPIGRACSAKDEPFTLPDGARYLGYAREYVILAVRDAHAVFKRLLAQIDKRDKLRLWRQDGEWSLSATSDGGGCFAHSFAHGSLVWLSDYSD